MPVKAFYAFLMSAVFSAACVAAAGAQSAVTGSQTSDVIEPPHGVAMLRWSRPVQNTDGSPLTDLAGYAILYGTGTPVFYYGLFVDADVNEVEIGGLPSGDWYFLITSVNGAGIPSEFSATVSATIQ